MKTIKAILKLFAAGIGIVFLFLVLVVLALAFCSNTKEPNKEQNSTSVVQKEPLLPIPPKENVVSPVVPSEPVEACIDFEDFERAKDIINLFKENEFLAIKKYKGKTTCLFGKTSQVQMDLFDEPFVVLDGGRYGFTGLHAELDKNDNRLELIKKGDILLLSCSDAGEAIGSPMFKNCKITKGIHPK
jgi:Na+-transporting methylmalonyl-CoA/oxaloacetate decarboxylase gamma subunit